MFTMQYINDFPTKQWNGRDVTITTRQLLCHKGGIRHYQTKEQIDRKKEVGVFAKTQGGLDFVL
jgi:CubicO group peptidase (beta-lactamase class C family)